MNHFRAHYESYLSVAIIVMVLSALAFFVVMPAFGIRFHLSSFVMMGAILLIAGAILRSLLHVVDNVDRMHGAASPRQ